MLNIELRPEYILNLGGVDLTNSFLTTLWVTLILMSGVLAFTLFKKSFPAKVLQVVVFELLRLTDTLTRNRELSKQVLPLVATFFIFIFSANLFALMPGFLGSFYLETSQGKIALLRSPNSDLTTTLALAIFSVGAIQVFALRTLGLKGYLARFFNLQNPLSFLLGFFEMLSEGVKVLSFSMRLFGNIFAGEILLLVIAFLVPYLLPLPFLVLEVFVGVIQAFIFAMLTLTFIKTSLVPHLPNAARSDRKVAGGTRAITYKEV